jgi:dihydroflavonol-4-reductase
VYESDTFSRLIRRELGNPFCIRIVMPIFLMRAVCALGSLWARISGQITALNNDKFHILAQRNWRCDISRTRAELGYSPKVKLAEGVRKSVAWYKQSGWI